MRQKKEEQESLTRVELMRRSGEGQGKATRGQREMADGRPAADTAVGSGSGRVIWQCHVDAGCMEGTGDWPGGLKVREARAERGFGPRNGLREGLQGGHDGQEQKQNDNGKENTHPHAPHQWKLEEEGGNEGKTGWESNSRASFAHFEVEIDCFLAPNISRKCCKHLFFLSKLFLTLTLG